VKKQKGEAMVLGWLTAMLARAQDDQLDHVQCPGAVYSAQIEAITALLESEFRKYEWASFDAHDGASGHTVTVRVSGTQVNTLTEPIDLPGVLRAAGLEALAAKVNVEEATKQHRTQAHDVQWGEQPVAGTLFSLPVAMANELAVIVNTVFRQRYGFSPMYAFFGFRED
jgi:hypothetical protein